MNRVFADASYWIAVFNPKDSLNAAARAASQTLGKARIVTTDEVLIEFVNYFSKGDAHVRTGVAELLREIRADRKVDVLPQTRDSFDAGFAWFQLRSDKHSSLTDCFSFAAMKTQGLSDALTDDRHFEQEGFKRLMVQNG